VEYSSVEEQAKIRRTFAVGTLRPKTASLKPTLQAEARSTIVLDHSLRSTAWNLSLE